MMAVPAQMDGGKDGCWLLRQLRLRPRASEPRATCCGTTTYARARGGPEAKAASPPVALGAGGVGVGHHHRGHRQRGEPAGWSERQWGTSIVRRAEGAGA